MTIELTEYVDENNSISVLEMLKKELDNAKSSLSKVISVSFICQKVRETLKHKSILEFLDYTENHFFNAGKSYKFQFKIDNNKRWALKIRTKMDIEDNFILKNFKIEPNYLYKIKIELQ